MMDWTALTLSLQLALMTTLLLLPLAVMLARPLAWVSFPGKGLIDALVTLATNPFKYLVGPRIIAAVVTLPILVGIADVIGIMGGYIVGTRSIGLNGYAYIRNTADFLEFSDVSSGLIKAAVFGFIIAVMGCYHGFNSKGGAQGVGRATTNAVVSSAILILAANFALTSLLFAD